MDVNGGGAKVTASSLNIRSAPSTESNVLGQIPQGQVAQITGVNKGWLQVKYNGVQGFISPEYIEIVAGQAQENTGAAAVITYAKQFIGTPYRYGGSSPSGFDCSGFTSYVYKQFGISIQRTASGQLNNGYAVSRGELKPGDLVMFKSYGSKPASHVGIYIGGGEFVHASAPGVGVVIDSLNSSFYSRTYVGARRIL